MTKHFTGQITLNVDNNKSVLMMILKRTAGVAAIVFSVAVCFEIHYINEEIKSMKSYREILIDHRLNKIEETVGLVE